MDDDSACLYPYCDRQSVGLYSLRLCHAHVFKTVLGASRLADDPEQDGDDVERLRELSRLRKEQWRKKRAEEVVEQVPILTNVQREWVYFLAFGDRVKIGYSTNLAGRLSSLPYDKVLAVIPGSMADEKRLHRQFAHLRVVREWFRAEPELLDYIGSLGYQQTPEAARTLAPEKRRKYPVTITRIAVS